MNATDKELLEMAARAAGLTMGWRNDPDYGGSETPCILDGEDFGCWWNPLSDDGDALRLAVTLEIGVDFFSGFKQVICHRHADRENCDMHGVVGYGAGADRRPSAENARRTIVIAAAEIGKSMTKESDHEH